MPLAKRARIEVYLPSGAGEGRLQAMIERELIYVFGGCTVVAGAKGSYLSASGVRETDSIELIYADTPFDPEDDLEAVSRYADELKQAALDATKEESLLIVVHHIYHSV